MDTYLEGPLLGTLYPTEAMPQSRYIGYTHDADWVKLTVDVKQAGTYTLTSTWASEPGGEDAIKFQVSFNDVLKADVSLPGTGGYHNWVLHEDFATVELDAGVQVLQFAPKSFHLNYDYLQLSLVLPGGGVDDGSGGAASMGMGGAGMGGAGAMAEGGAATMGMSGAAATMGGADAVGMAAMGGAVTVTPPALGGQTTGVDMGGMVAGMVGAGTAVDTGTAGMTGTDVTPGSDAPIGGARTETPAGCALGVASERRSGILWLGLVGVGIWLARRRSGSGAPAR